MKRDRWRDVKVTCDTPTIPEPPEVPINHMAPRFVTAMKVKEMMKAHFPDGPRAAQRAHEAYCVWRRENVIRFFDQKTTMNTEALKWKALDDSWRKWAISEEDRGVMHGRFDCNRVDFNGLDRRLRPGLSL